jgi:hypothetical protein
MSTAAAPAEDHSDRSVDARTRKFRLAAFAYLHVGLLYESTVYVVWQRGRIPASRAAWVLPSLLAGAAIVALVFWLLWSRKSVWTARIVWGVHAFRLPALVEGAFFNAGHGFPPHFYGAALVVVLINLAFLARAGWNL